MPTDDEYGFGSTGFRNSSDEDSDEETGYGSSGYGSSGYGQSGGYGESDMAGSPYSEVAGSDTALGGGDTPLEADLYQNGYKKNPYEVDFFDTPYTESAADPSGRRFRQTARNRRTSQDYGDEDQLVL
jgi:hypothetical protein